MIRITNLKKSFGSQLVLKDIYLEIGLGETIAIVGPSGTGKSVLLKIITGLLKQDSGEVRVGDEVISRNTSESKRREICSKMGVLFQSAALFDSMNVYENVAFPLKINTKLSSAEIAQKVASRLEEVDMLAFSDYLPGEISMGMQKRVGIARALVTKPDILLFDEPNTGLDPLMGQEIYELIKLTSERRKFTGIVISHEIPEVFQVAERVCMLYGGSVQWDSDIDGFMNSQDPVVRQFVTGEREGPIQISA